MDGGLDTYKDGCWLGLLISCSLSSQGQACGNDGGRMERRVGGEDGGLRLLRIGSWVMLGGILGLDGNILLF